MDFTYLEKKAMVKMLTVLSISDGRADPNEIQLVMDTLQVDGAFIKLSLIIPTSEAVRTLKQMSNDKKLKFAEILAKLVKADGIIHPAELAVYKGILDDIGLSELLNKLR